MNSELAGLIFACAVVAWMLFRFFRYGGIIPGLFGARIKRTVGEVDTGSGTLWSTVLKVHALGGSPSKAIGLEAVSKTLGGVGGYESNVVSLSTSEAKKLAALIHLATQE